MKIAIAADHAGFEYKNSIISFLTNQGYEVIDFGTDSTNSCDYPDYSHPCAVAVESNKCDFGILLCGTANGMTIVANKHAGIRAGLAWNEEVAGIIRAHNDANMIGIPARFVSLDMALSMITRFLNTPFEGGRHENRVKKIPC